MKKTLLFLSLLLSALLLASCGSIDYSYDDAHLYTQGGASLSSPVSELDIDWLCGGVNVLLHDSEVVTFSEESSKTIKDDQALRYFLKDGCLSIKYAKSATLGANLPEKILTVYLPRTAVLNDVEIDVASASVNISEIASRSVSIESASGNITLTECDVSTSLEAETATASLTLNDCRIKGEIDVETASGNANLNLLSAPLAMDIESAAGDVTLTLPKDTGASLRFDTVTGRCEISLPYVTENGVIKLGDGKREYEISLTAGKLTVN